MNAAWFEARGIRVYVRAPESPDKNWRVSLDDECGRFAFGPDLDRVYAKLARLVLQDEDQARPTAMFNRTIEASACFLFGFELGLLFCLITGALFR